MEPLYIEESKQTPKIILDKQNGIFEITGKSVPDDPVAFYTPVIDWIQQYIKDPNDKTELMFFLIYMNTASSKVFSEIFHKLRKLQEKGYEMNVRWHYEFMDYEMKEVGQEFAEITGVDFHYVVEEDDEGES